MTEKLSERPFIDDSIKQMVFDMVYDDPDVKNTPSAARHAQLLCALYQVIEDIRMVRAQVMLEGAHLRAAITMPPPDEEGCACHSGKT